MSIEINIDLSSMAYVMPKSGGFHFTVELTAGERFSIWLRRPWRLPPRTEKHLYVASPLPENKITGQSAKSEAGSLKLLLAHAECLR